MRLWFRRRKNTTTKGENMAVSVKNLEITLAADGGLSIYQTIRQVQGFLDDTEVLADVVPSLSRLLNQVNIGKKRAVAAILTETAPGEDYATELDDLIEAMSSGYGREVKKPAKGKASVEPVDRLYTVSEKAEAMREAVVYLLGSALAAVTDFDTKKIKQTLNNLDVPERLIAELIAAPEKDDEPDIAEPVKDVKPVSLKAINNVSKAEKVDA